MLGPQVKMMGPLNIVRLSPLFEVGKQLIKSSIPRIFLKRFQNESKRDDVVIDEPNVPKVDVVDVESDKDKAKLLLPLHIPID